MKLNLNVYTEQFRSDIKSYECKFIKKQCQCDADFNLIYFNLFSEMRPTSFGKYL